MALLTSHTTAAAVGNRAAFRGTSLQARPAVLPRRRAARAVSQTVSARAAAKQAYICVDCGYIYDGSDGPFDKLPSSYKCPVCSAPKRRFKAYDGRSGKNDSKSMNSRWEAMQAGGGGGGGEAKEQNSALLPVGLAVGAAGLAALYSFLSSQYN